MYNHVRRCGEVTVKTAGRKWLEVEGQYDGRIALDTMQADGRGFASSGRCYASREAWLQQEGPGMAYDELCSRMPRRCPEGLSQEAFLQAAKLLGLELTIERL